SFANSGSHALETRNLLCFYFRLLRGRHLDHRGFRHFQKQVIRGHAQMNAVVLKGHYRSPQATASRDLIAGLQFIQHSLPFFLLPLLGQDQKKVKNGENEDERRNPEPSHTAATGLYRQKLLHALRGLSGYIRKSSRHLSAA